MGTTIKTHHKGPYTIRAMPIAETYQAQVFRGSGTIGPRHEGTTAEDAVRNAEDWINDRAAIELKERQETGAPSIDAYREALKLVGLNRGERAMLDAHIRAPWHKLTATELAHAAGWENWSAANLHYGGLGRKIAEVIDWKPPVRVDGTPIWTMAIATPSSLDDVSAEEELDFLMSAMENGGEFEWTLRPQVIAALQDLSSSVDTPS